MKLLIPASILLFLCSMPLAAGPYAVQANDNPFLAGELNPRYEGEVTALAGEVIKVEMTKQKYPVYLLELRMEGIKPIWVTSIAPEPGGKVKLGDNVIFKGFISIASGLDPSGELEKMIESKTLLLAVQAQRAK